MSDTKCIGNVNKLLFVNKRSRRHFERFIKHGEIGKIKKQIAEKKVIIYA